MNVKINNITIEMPEYFHREYENDLPKGQVGEAYIDQCKRIALVALPFISLYKPFTFPLAVALGCGRVLASFPELVKQSADGSLAESSQALLQASISVIALSATLVAHPLGMLVTTAHDCALTCFSILQNLSQGNVENALRGSFELLNNTLYLALFLHGGLEIAVASLAMQAFIGLSHSLVEYQKGNYLEASGHVLMGIIRSNQMMGQLQILQSKWKVENVIKNMKDGIVETTTAGAVKNVNGLNQETLHALRVEDTTIMGDKAQIAYYANNIYVVTFPDGRQTVYQGEETQIASTLFWCWENIGEALYTKHVYGNYEGYEELAIYSGESEQFMVIYS